MKFLKCETCGCKIRFGQREVCITELYIFVVENA